MGRRAIKWGNNSGSSFYFISSIIPVIFTNASHCLSIATIFAIFDVFSNVNFNSFNFPVKSFSSLSISLSSEVPPCWNALLKGPFFTTHVEKRKDFISHNCSLAILASGGMAMPPPTFLHVFSTCRSHLSLSSSTTPKHSKELVREINFPFNLTG